MDTVVLIAAMGLRLALVFLPATIAGLALQRVAASRSRNRMLYAAICLVTGYTAIDILATTMTGTPLNPFVVMAALASPVGWGIILWVVWLPGGALYIDEDHQRNTLAMLTRSRNTRPETLPTETRETSHVTAKTAGRSGADPVFKTCQQKHRWRPETPLPFVPGCGRPR